MASGTSRASTRLHSHRRLGRWACDSCTACLPSTTRIPSSAAEIVGETDTKEGLEVINDVFESPASIVFDLAENRPPTIKALLVVILGQ